MARIYSRRKGKSGSTRPFKRQKPSWVRYEAKEVETLVTKYGKAGKTAAEIGLLLRDAYGIPDVKAITGKRIQAILHSHGLSGKVPSDLRALIQRDVEVMKHMESNKHDVVAKRGMQLTESKIHRLITYYKRTGLLPADFVYARDKAKAYVD